MKFQGTLLPLWLLFIHECHGSAIGQVQQDKRTVTCTRNVILDVFEDLSNLAKPFCSEFTRQPFPTIPGFAQAWSAVPGEISSACSCLNSPSRTTSTPSTTSVSKTSASSTHTSSSPSPTSLSSSSSSASTSSSPSVTSLSSTSSSTSTSSIVSTSTIASGNSTCTVTAFSQVASATASCTAIVIKDLTVPANQTLNLSALKTGTSVVFSGYTTFEYANTTINLIDIGGTNIDISAEPDAVIDGNGQSWWDGQGSNGGIPKPDHFIAVSKALGTSTIHSLYIQNYPTHCFSISNSANLTLHTITLNNTAGNAPNAMSSGLPAAHNTDGFDMSTCNDCVIRDSIVLNQDDCVAITSGDSVLVSNMYCDGGHGLSIGSVGGKSNNNVTNILFRDSLVLNSQNGPRIKTNYNTTGYIANVTYQNIAVSNISVYGLDVQQDYLNGGPTGIPSNGVLITNLTMINVTGTAQATAKDYYILCGSGSCQDFYFEDVHIVGGSNNSCNVQPQGDFSCA